MEDTGQHEGWIAASLDEVAAGDPAMCLLSPLTATLNPHLATMACALPIGDINGGLLDAADGRAPAPAATFAGVLAHDPFRRHGELVDSLVAAGFPGIANWPSVAPLSGELAAALDHSGFRYEEELALLRRAAAADLRTAVIVHTREHLEAALEQEPDTIIVTPGLSGPDADRRQQRSDAVIAMVAEARRTSSGNVRVHLHPGFTALLELNLPEGVGVLRHHSRS